MTWTSETIMQTIGKHMLNECITNARLVELTGLKPEQVQSSTALLRSHGYIKVVDQGCYRVTQAGIKAFESDTNLRSGPKGPIRGVHIVKDTLRVRVWRAIRIRQSVSIPELAGIVKNGTERNPEINIRKYLVALEGAGYLIRMKKRMPGTSPTSNGFARWRLDLEKNTGPEAPVWRQHKGTIFDPNTGEEIVVKPMRAED
ncbi:MAG: hypothetical protein DYH15_12090 [Nitrosomonas sp. PRO4]|nr:hypothetical protein [Nitrosomonas sp. PRO4]